MNSNTNWSIDKYQVTVNGKPFFANGVSYSPVPWGSCTAIYPFGDFTINTWSSIWQRDLPIMRSNSVNLLKTYNTLDKAQLTPASLPFSCDHDHSDFLNACWNKGVNPIYVLMGYAPPVYHRNIFLKKNWSSKANIEARKKIKTDFVNLAETYGQFPAVMGFVLANEINDENTTENPKFFAYWNDVAKAIDKAASGKLTVLVNKDDSMDAVKAGNEIMTAPNFFWGYNCYRGNWTHSNGFDSLFSTYQSAVTTNPTPLMVTEWGAPATTHNTKRAIKKLSSSQMQNLEIYITGHYNNMLANRSDYGTGVCCGGAYFEWTDEHWKADAKGEQCTQRGGTPNCRATSWDAGPDMTPQTHLPGGFYDEEGYGLNAIAPVTPGSRTPLLPGGCIGALNPETNKPYEPDVLTARDHALALFNLFRQTTSLTPKELKNEITD